MIALNRLRKKPERHAEQHEHDAQNDQDDDQLLLARSGVSCAVKAAIVTKSADADDAEA